MRQDGPSRAERQGGADRSLCCCLVGKRYAAAHRAGADAVRKKAEGHEKTAGADRRGTRECPRAVEDGAPESKYRNRTTRGIRRTRSAGREGSNFPRFTD